MQRLLLANANIRLPGNGSLDFILNQLVDHRRFRVLNIMDDCSKFCPGQIVDLSISGARLARDLDEIALLVW